MSNVVYSFIAQYPGNAYYNRMKDGNESGFKFIGKFKTLEDAAKACVKRAEKIIALHKAQGLDEPTILGIDHMKKYYIKDS